MRKLFLYILLLRSKQGKRLKINLVEPVFGVILYVLCPFGSCHCLNPSNLMRKERDSA